ncbi:HD domain-containing protein [Rhizobium sullae]|uniref:HD domain-containing protein n=1 Tax=Rhizobium sullae TaxID=50338 RepID=A0A4R3PRP2_RHISU|nr:HD domain-containing protein [Rhizobium sullae]TCU07011.1 HD domain-containing protein [Rhizobium sullae]
MQASLHLDHAVQIAVEAHAGQTDKTGAPYFEHCRRVALAVIGDEEKIVAYLHDVAEKGTGWTVDRLKEEGFPPAVVSAVDALTRRQNEDDEPFIRRAISNDIARRVKRADLEDNLSQAQQIGADTSKYDRGLTIISETRRHHEREE